MKLKKVKLDKRLDRLAVEYLKPLSDSIYGPCGMMQLSDGSVVVVYADSGPHFTKIKKRWSSVDEAFCDVFEFVTHRRSKETKEKEASDIIVLANEVMATGNYEV